MLLSSMQPGLAQNSSSDDFEKNLIMRHCHLLRRILICKHIRISLIFRSRGLKLSKKRCISKIECWFFKYKILLPLSTSSILSILEYLSKPHFYRKVNIPGSFPCSNILYIVKCWEQSAFKCSLTFNVHKHLHLFSF